jgi:hypothetical protein
MDMTDFAALLETARNMSADAAFAQLCTYGDNADCGGAWVVIPARQGFARWLKASGIGSKHHAGGWSVSVVPGIRAQSRVIYEKAADAFVNALSAAGVEAHTYSYAD